jgi:hypothetical protein
MRKGRDALFGAAIVALALLCALWFARGDEAEAWIAGACALGAVGALLGWQAAVKRWTAGREAADPDEGA